MEKKIIDDNLDWIEEYCYKYSESLRKFVLDASCEELYAALKVIELAHNLSVYHTKSTLELIQFFALATNNFCMTNFQSDSVVKEKFITEYEEVSSIIKSVCELLFPERFAYCWPGCPCQQTSILG